MEHVELVESNPAWPAMFDAEARLLRDVLPNDFILRMEHFGSSSVPGIAAKPIIDILIGVRDLDEARITAEPLLAPHFYEFWTENPLPDRIMFIKRNPAPGNERTHHLHMTTLEGALWESVLFRDLLREDVSERAAYEGLKRTLAKRFRDERSAYTSAKSEHIRAATARARARFGG